MKDPQQQSRHDQLLAAGWSYDATSDMYTAPDDPKDGTARQHNQMSAWLRFSTAKPAPAQQRADPRRKEPE